MKKLTLTLLAISALSVAGSAFAAAAPAAKAAVASSSAIQFGVVDYVQVFQQTPQGNATLDQLKSDLKPQINGLKAQQATIEAAVKQLDVNAPTMTQAARDDQAKKLQAEQDAFQAKVTALQKQEAQKEQAAADAFNKALSDAVEQVAIKDHLSVVFNAQATPYVADRYDVTNEVVAAMQAEKAGQ